MGTITVSNTNDSGSGSLRNAVDDSIKVTLKNLIIANGTGGSTENGGKDILTGAGDSEPSGETEQFAGFPGLSIAIQHSQEAVSEFSGVNSVEATLLLPAVQKVREAAHRGLSGFITGGNGNDSLNSGGQDTEFGGGVGDDYLNARFSDTSSPLLFPATNPSPSFTGTIDDEGFSSPVAESDEISSLASVHLTIVGSASLVTNTPLPYKVSLTSESSPVDDSIKVTLKNLIIANATGESQDKSTESGGHIVTGEGDSEPSPDSIIDTDNGNDVVSEVGNDILIGGDSEPSGEAGKKLKQLRPLGTTVTDTLNDELFSSQTEESDEASSLASKTITLTSEQLFLSQLLETGGISPLVGESITLTSGASPGEATLLLPAVQKVREAARFSGASSVESTLTSIGEQYLPTNPNW